jgi:glutaconate CoA-transferase subunit A
MGSGFNQTHKQCSLAELAALVPDGASIALGGSFLHRGPFAFVRELIRQGRRDLELVKQSPGYDVDILCRACAPASWRWKAISAWRRGIARPSSAAR